MYLKKNWGLLLVPLVIGACTGSKSSRYKDTAHLEKPPIIVVAEKPRPPVPEIPEEEDENTGLGQVVSLSGSADLPIIKIKKIFNPSWDIVEQGLNLSEIEITDKNRDEGVFYLKFDPDKQAAKDAGLLDSISFFLFKDEYDEASYKLFVQWHESHTAVSVELIEQDEDSFLDDDKGDFDSPTDLGVMLINALYKTIRDDLPLD